MTQKKKKLIKISRLQIYIKTKFLTLFGTQQEDKTKRKRKRERKRKKRNGLKKRKLNMAGYKFVFYSVLVVFFFVKT